MDQWEDSWRIAGEQGRGDAVADALARSHATLWYGPRCFGYSQTRDEVGNFVLRLQAVGHLLPVGFEAPVLVLGEDVCAAQQIIAPDGERESTEVVQRLGRALFDDVARTTDLEAQWP